MSKSESSITRETGTVKFYKSMNGYGFIIPDKGGPEVFVHYTELVDSKSLNKGDVVSYVPKENNKGLKAEQVMIERSVLEDIDTVDELSIAAREAGYRYRD